jgi:hypothetical protein
MGISGVPLEKNKIINALHLKKGVIAHAALLIPCSAVAVYEWVNKDPEVAEALRKARENAAQERLDQDEVIKQKAYASIEDLLDKKDPTATIFALKSKCGWSQNSTDNSIILKFQDPTHDERNNNSSSVQSENLSVSSVESSGAGEE